MLPVANTILSLFAVIFIGVWARRKGLIPPNLFTPINRLVYYVGIPSLLFREISKAPFHQYFEPRVLVGLLIPPVVVFLVCLGLGKAMRMEGRRLGTFVQASMHGNLGYMGLAVAFYALGPDGFRKAGLLASFLILVQNFLAILALQLGSGGRGRKWDVGYFLHNLLLNPIILACFAGILVSFLEIALPRMIDNVLRILSGMALPLALLLIGASLSLGSSRGHLFMALLCSVFKLMLLPAIGVALYRWLDLSGSLIVPSIILLSSPTATVTYVMAGELGGDQGLASTTISVSTLLSGLSFAAWLVVLL